MLTGIWKVIFHLKVLYYCWIDAVEALVKLTVCRVLNLEASKSSCLIPGNSNYVMLASDKERRYEQSFSFIDYLLNEAFLVA
jgi:hypothetical protein